MIDDEHLHAMYQASWTSLFLHVLEVLRVRWWSQVLWKGKASREGHHAFKHLHVFCYLSCGYMVNWNNMKQHDQFTIYTTIRITFNYMLRSSFGSGRKTPPVELHCDTPWDGKRKGRGFILPTSRCSMFMFMPNFIYITAKIRRSPTNHCLLGQVQ